MTTKEIVAAADFYPAGEAPFTISSERHIFHQRMLLTSCGLLSNYYATKI